MKTNGVVHSLKETTSGFVRWKAECLLCPWPPGQGRLYASKAAASLGIARHLHIMHHLNPKDRQVVERKSQAVAPRLSTDHLASLPAPNPAPKLHLVPAS